MNEPCLRRLFGPSIRDGFGECEGHIEKHADKRQKLTCLFRCAFAVVYSGIPFQSERMRPVGERLRNSAFLVKVIDSCFQVATFGTKFFQCDFKNGSADRNRDRRVAFFAMRAVSIDKKPPSTIWPCGVIQRCFRSGMDRINLDAGISTQEGLCCPNGLLNGPDGMLSGLKQDQVRTTAQGAQTDTIGSDNCLRVANLNRHGRKFGVRLGNPQIEFGREAHRKFREFLTVTANLSGAEHAE